MDTSAKKPLASKSAGKSTSTRAKSTKSTQTRKTTGAKSAAKSGPLSVDSVAPAGDVATAETSPVIRAEMKKRELITSVVERSGVRRKFAKPAVEAALAVLGEALADNRELNLAPLGKIKINRIKKSTRGQVIIAKVRQISQGKGTSPDDGPGEADQDVSDPLAHAAE